MDQPYKRRKLSQKDSDSASNRILLHTHRRQDHNQDYIVEQHRHLNDAHGHDKPKGPRHERRQVQLGTGATTSSIIQPTASSTATDTSVSSDTASAGVTSSAYLSSTASSSGATTTSLSSTVSGSVSIGLSGSVVVGLTGASTSTATPSIDSSTASSSTASSSTASSSTASSSTASSSTASSSTSANTASSSSTPLTGSTATSSTSIPSSNSNGTSTFNTSTTALATSASLSTSRSATNGSSIFPITSATASSSLTSASSGFNLTTSTFVFSDSSTTYTSYSVFGGASTSNDFSTTVTTMSDGAVATIDYERQEVIATLSNGDLTTYFGSYSVVSTLSPSSSPSSSSSTASSSHTGSTSSSATSTVASSPGATGAASMAGSTTSSAPTSSSTLSSSGDSTSSTPPTSELAGGIVGGVAGLAVVLLVVVVFLRWYRKRMANMQPLTRGEATPALAGGPGAASGGPKMKQRTGFAPVLAPLLGGRKFKNRQEAESGPEPATGERGFQRISGRKLPSAFSEGIEGMSTTRSPPPLMPAAFENGRESYRNSAAWSNEALGPFADPTDGSEVISPRLGPARTATVHPGGGWTTSPTSAVTMTSPNWPLASRSEESIVSPMNAHFPPSASFSRPGTADRMSDTPSSYDGNRGSRFTEDV